MSRPGLVNHDEVQRFPRVSGDEPLRYERFHVVIGFSPRERG